MNTYYLRCRQSQYHTLLDRGARMGAILVASGVATPCGVGCWDYIGVKYVDDLPVGGADDPWLHVNFRTEHDLRELALAAAANGDSDIANGLKEIVSYFITDEEGNPTAPDVPLRVFL